MRKCLGGIFDSDIDSALSKHIQLVAETAHMSIGELPCGEYSLRYSVNALTKAKHKDGREALLATPARAIHECAPERQSWRIFFLQHICSVDSFISSLPVPRAPLLIGVI
ncbi:hypothetical protein MCOR25_000969 [Pyricularia grisea]|nr:hypothetical protein MCOR25_000969 [Pyricularia grisea]